MGVKMTPTVVQDKLRKLGHVLFSTQKMTTIPRQAHKRIKSPKKKSIQQQSNLN